MSELHTCPTCHQQSNIYTHTIGKGITLALLKLKRAVLDHDRNSIHPVYDMDGTPYELTKNERGNWTMLRYHGLIAKDEAKGKGYWLLTRRGSAFIKGASIPAKVRVLNNRVLQEPVYGQYDVTISEVLSDKSRPLFTEIEALDRENVPVETSQGGLFDLGVVTPKREVRDLG